METKKQETESREQLEKFHNDMEKKRLAEGSKTSNVRKRRKKQIWYGRMLVARKKQMN